MEPLPPRAEVAPHQKVKATNTALERASRLADNDDAIAIENSNGTLRTENVVEQVKPKPTLWPLFIVLGLASVLGLGFLGLLAAAFYTGFHRSYTDGLYRASRARGDAAYSRRDYQAAADAYRQMIEARPHAARGYGLRADCYFEMGRYTAAISDDTQAIRLARGAQYLAQLHYDQGNGYEARQDFALAVADYTEALRLTPGDAEALQARRRVPGPQGLPTRLPGRRRRDRRAPPGE